MTFTKKVEKRDTVFPVQQRQLRKKRSKLVARSALRRA